MDSQVQNFSLPNRSNSRRPFSPVPAVVTSENRSGSRMDDGDDMAAMASALHHADGSAGDGDAIDRVPVRSPTPTALQLFHFTEDAVLLANRRSSRVLPRPMSTSSSAPALGNISKHADAGADDGRPGPCSCASVWPRPRSAYAGAVLTQSRSARDVSHDTATATPQDTDESPPPIARSISVRWGPRLRHISMSEVQAADDAARRVAAARRERILFWTLVATALIGVLSCTAAVTLAAAQAALQAGLEDVGEGGGIVWDARTLGWLIASLILCTSAAVGLVVATSTRCRRSRRLNRWRSRTPTPPPPSTSPSPTDRPKDKPASKGNDKTTAAAPGANRLSNLLPSHQEDGAAKGAWVEMQEVGTKRDSVVEQPAKWWHFGGTHMKGNGQGHGPGKYGNVDQHSPQTSLHDSPNETAFKRAVSSGDGTMDVPDEDRNWAKFSRDTVQLRRYVESLEARLAGSQDAPAAKPDKMNNEHTSSISPKRIRIRPSTSVRTITSADTATTAATSTTIQPVMGVVGASAPHSAYSLLLPPGSPASVVPASMVSSSSSRRPRNSTANDLTLGRNPGHDVTGSVAPPMPAHTATLPASDTQTSILGQLYSSYSDRGRV